MVTAWPRWMTAALVLGAALGTIDGKVLNEDHCANQAVPGGAFCRDRYGNAAPYGSPCRRELHGCVDYEPFAYAGYYDEIDDGAAESSGSSGVAASSSCDGGKGSTAAKAAARAARPATARTPPPEAPRPRPEPARARAPLT